MDEMIELLEIILNFENKMISFWISCIQSINEQNEIIKKYNLELMNYFNNFKSVNLENIINNIPSDGILEDYRFKELTSVFGYLYEISQEYDINAGDLFKVNIISENDGLTIKYELIYKNK